LGRGRGRRIIGMIFGRKKGSPLKLRRKIPFADPINGMEIGGAKQNRKRAHHCYLVRKKKKEWV
jgi:hypothetical protein